MKKIRIVMQNLKIGGAEKVLCTFLQNFDREKYCVNLVLHTKEGELLDAVPKDVKVVGLVPRDNGSLINRVFRSLFFKLLLYFPIAIKLLIRFKVPDSDITVSYMEGIATKIASILSGPKIAWIHTDVEKNPWADKFYRNLKDQERVYLKFKKIIFVSKGSMIKFNNKFSSINYQVEKVVHNPVSNSEVLAKGKEKDQDLKKWYAATSGTFRVITVGRLDKVKRNELLVESIKLILDKGYPVSLTLVGEGAERDALEIVAEKYKNIHFVGYQANPLQYVSKSDLFVSVSRVESYPTAIIESIILNTPVLATINAGTLEVFGKYKDKLLEDGISKKELSTEIIEEIKDISQEKETFSEMSKMFDINEVLKSYDEVFEVV